MICIRNIFNRKKKRKRLHKVFADESRGQGILKFLLQYQGKYDTKIIFAVLWLMIITTPKNM